MRPRIRYEEVRHIRKNVVEKRNENRVGRVGASCHVDVKSDGDWCEVGLTLEKKK